MIMKHAYLILARNEFEVLRKTYFLRWTIPEMIYLFILMKK